MRRRRVEGASDVSYLRALEGQAGEGGPSPARPRRQSARVASLLRSASAGGSRRSSNSNSNSNDGNNVAKEEPLDMSTVAVALLVAVRLKDAGGLAEREYVGLKDAIVQHDGRVRRVVDEWRTTGDDDRLEQATRALAAMTCGQHE